MTTVEVFADVTCPFAHVGLKRVAAHLAAIGPAASLIVRAWPLEWVNGQPMEIEAVMAKARTLRTQLGVDDFAGLDPRSWPTTTLPALELAALAYERDAATGRAVSLELRAALFEEGRNIGDEEVLAMLAGRHGLRPHGGIGATVQADYDDGRRRGVMGSPHFFVGDRDFFCPSLDLDHDADGHLTARFDDRGLADFLDAVT
jgi:2-hydroxychromene-2-carboxylate isomerase